MNKKLIGVIVAFVVVMAAVGIAIGFGINKSIDDSSNNSKNNSSSVNPSSEFKPQTLDTLSYITTSTTTVGGQTSTSTTENDGKGLMKTVTDTGTIKSETYVSKNTIVSCVNGACTKSEFDANSAEGQAATKSLDNLSKEYKDSIKNAGKGNCPAGTCDVWKANAQTGEVRYYIDSQNRISKLVTDTTEITYEYKTVSITVPTV